MVRSIGIDPGDQTVKVVELEGSYRKTRLLRVHTARAAAQSVATQSLADVGAKAEVVAAATRAALDEGMRGELTLGHPLREAVLRVIELPFKGRDAIRKVVKSEIEGEIHSHSVDDMIVDFHEIGEGAEGGTRVMVASVPKPGLRTQLDAFSGQSVEVETIDIDAMALWRAAQWAGAFKAGDAAAPADSSPTVTAVLDLGARSVKMLLVQGERLVEMRALRIGDAVVADEVARRHGLDAAVAREVVRACLDEGADQRLEVADALPAPAGAGEATAPSEDAPKRAVVVTHAEVHEAQTSYLQRLARELARYLTSSGKASQIRALWITGGAVRSPRTKAMLEEVFGVEPRELDLLSHLQHDLDAATAAELGPRLATAIGLALGRLGGPAGFNLRQEDLLLTRGFERIKFPLAITCMVALLALFVHANRRSIELKNLELEIGSTYVDKTNPKAMPVFHGMLNRVFSNKWFEDPVNDFHYVPSKGKEYRYKDLIAELVQADVHRRIMIVRDRLKLAADQKQKESGVYEDISLESGLAVLVRLSEILLAVEPQIKGYLVTRLELNMKAPNRKLEMTVAFRGEDCRNKMSVLRAAIDEDCAKPDSPFEPLHKNDDGAKETLFSDTAESGVTGAYFKVLIRIKDSFRPFGPSSVALGAADEKLAPAKSQLAGTGGGK
ncbi:MAG TPA: pilus assembly protein PilM [Planctomycetota bacterium]|nr:pilus assembly protein PilM [Planctomycetota bacterium]